MFTCTIKPPTYFMLTISIQLAIQQPTMKFIILVVVILAAVSADPLFHKKSLLKLPLIPIHAAQPEARIIEKTVEVIKPIEVIKEVPVIKTVEVIKEVPIIKTVEVEKPVEVIRHVPIVKTVVQRVAVPYPVHIERRVPYPVHIERHVPVPVTVERLHTPITTTRLVAETSKVHPLTNLLLKGHSIHKRSPILKKLKAKIHTKKAFLKGGIKKLFG